MSEQIEKGAEPVKPKTLVQKLCEVMAAVGYLQKKGSNEKQDYKYIREADVVAKMRDEFAKRNVFIFPTMLHHERTKLSKMEYDKVKESYVTDLVMRWTFVDGDSGEERVCDIPGCSASPGDKGVYVAMTGSEKYLLMKSFLLPTGDDPENDANEESVSKEVERQKKGKAFKDEPKKVDTLFFTYPEKHNGHFAEWVNIREYVAAQQDKEDALRLLFTAHGAKKTKDETALVPFDKMAPLLEKLAGDIGVSVKELKPA